MIKTIEGVKHWTAQAVNSLSKMWTFHSSAPPIPIPDTITDGITLSHLLQLLILTVLIFSFIKLCHLVRLGQQSQLQKDAENAALLQYLLFKNNLQPTLNGAVGGRIAEDPGQGAGEDEEQQQTPKVEQRWQFGNGDRNGNVSSGATEMASFVKGGTIRVTSISVTKTEYAAAEMTKI